MHRAKYITAGFLLLTALACTALQRPDAVAVAADAQTVATTAPAPVSPVAPGATPKKLADGFLFTEGATSDANGNFYFVDQPNNRIMRWSINQKLSTWLSPSGHANGMSFDNKGNLIACADEKSQLWSITTGKVVKVIVSKYQQKYLNGPNDVWVDPKNGIYITDPFYKRPWWIGGRGQQMEQDKQCVYYLSPDRSTLKRVISDFQQPNGLIGTPDGKKLYVSDIAAGKTWSYTINADGSLTGKKLFNNYGSDGMTIDSAGNVYTTSNGAVQICDKTGTLIATIPIAAANVCFGGTDGHLLFFTAGKEIFSLRMSTHRVGPQ